MCFKFDKTFKFIDESVTSSSVGIKNVRLANNERKDDAYFNCNESSTRKRERES